jgi:HEAT repeat protein
VEQLLERAIQSPTVVLRLAAVESLGGVGTHAAVQTLAWAARLSDPEALSTAAMDGLRRVAASSGSGARSAIYALLQLGPDPLRRERVVQLLSTLSGPAITTLAAELKSSRPAIRTIAVEALARMRDAAATEHIASALSDPDPRVRGMAVTAFGRLGSSGISRAILTISTDDADASVRRRAAAVCRRYGWTPAAPGMP